MSLFSCSSEKEFNRWGDKLTQYVVEEYMPAKDYIWNWNEAVFLKSAVVRCENNMDKDYLFPYIQTAVDSTFGDANGHHPNAVISGLGLAYLAQTTGWAENPNRRNNEFWGRGNGWILMTLVDLMELLPENDENYPYLEASLTQKLNTLYPLQDEKTGHWYQLPIYPGEEGNFIESSSTAMYAYAAAKGIALGILPADKYMPMIDRAYAGLEANSLQPVGKYLKMKNICDGTCIGDKDYYYNRGIVNERAYAFGIAAMFYDQYHQPTAK